MRQLLHTKALVVRESVGATQNGVIDQIVGSTPVIDRMGDTIVQEGWDLKSFKENPVILWGHNLDQDRTPIARALKVWIDGKGKDAKLMFKVLFDLSDPFAASIYRKIKEGFINTVSVGFLPTEWEELEPGNFWGGLKYNAQQLLELSFVSVPANPEALVGLRSFAKKDPRFAPVDETKLFKPVNKEQIKEILNLSEKEEKAEDIAVDPNSTVGEDGSISSRDGGGGQDDHIENRPDGTALPYNHTDSMGDRTCEQMCTELNYALAYAADQTANANKGKGVKSPGGPGSQGPESEDGNGENANATDPYNDLHGMGDEAQMPPADMKVKDMTVGNMRAAMSDTLGGFMSDFNSTSNEGSNSEDMNNYSFTEGDTKEQKVHKLKGLISIVEKSGRVLSSKNENKIKNAVETLTEVLAELEKDEPAPTGEESKTEKKVEEEVVENRGVIPYASHGVAPESESWDASGEMAKSDDPAVWKTMCAWFDSENPDNKGSYKLPHHEGDGEHKAVWRGVAAAMAALLGARGGVDIPEADRKGVYNHLAKHYKEFEKEAPDFKSVEGQVLAGLDEELLALILDREEKHMVRLIKRVLENQKEEKKTQAELEKKKEEKMEQDVLKFFDLALSKIPGVGGGEK